MGAQCTAAAKAWGQSNYTSKSSWSTYPRGCFQYHGYKFYRNTHSTGKAQSNSGIVCIRGTTTPAPTRAPTPAPTQGKTPAPTTDYTISTSWGSGMKNVVLSGGYANNNDT